MCVYCVHRPGRPLFARPNRRVAGAGRSNQRVVASHRRRAARAGALTLERPGRVTDRPPVSMGRGSCRGLLDRFAGVWATVSADRRAVGVPNAGVLPVIPPKSGGFGRYGASTTQKRGAWARKTTQNRVSGAFLGRKCVRDGVFSCFRGLEGPFGRQGRLGLTCRRVYLLRWLHECRDHEPDSRQKCVGSRNQDH